MNRRVNYDELEKRFYQSIPQQGKQSSWYWLVIHAGNRCGDILRGPFTDEDEARKVGHSKFSVCFDIKELPTRSLATATQMYKSQKWDEPDVQDIDTALSRVKHK